MAQAKRKTATKTKKKAAPRCGKSCKKSCTRTTKCQGISNQERAHVYIITAMAMVAGILLWINVACMIV